MNSELSTIHLKNNQNTNIGIAHIIPWIKFLINPFHPVLGKLEMIALITNIIAGKINNTKTNNAALA